MGQRKGTSVVYGVFLAGYLMSAANNGGINTYERKVTILLYSGKC